ncbi:MAG: TonB-dependent receptor, partial [bacterium]|nr:TonB-dependent receptor [bacterium]
IQVNDNISILKGNHSIKAGVEYNEVGSSQTFIGFANGRYIFSTIDDFIAYASNPNPPSDAGGPVLLFLQFAGVGGLTPEQAGTQTLVQKETALFVQDTWQPTGNLTFDFGLRFEMIDQPPPSTPPSEVFYADFIGTTVTTAAGPQRFPSDGVIPDDEVIEPRLALAWSPKGRTNSVLRATAGLYAARTPALSWASVRSTNGSVGQTLFRNSFLGGIGVLPDPPAWPTLIPQSDVGSPFQPDVFVPDEDFELPKTYAFSLSWEQEIAPNYALLVKANYSKTDHITRWTNRNDALLGSPWSTGLGPGGFNGIGALNTVESSARSRYEAYTIGINKRYSNNFQFQAYYTYSKDESDDDNERDPFTIRYAKITDLGPEFSLSDRNQDHRFNAWMNWNAPWDLDVNLRLSYRSAQPLDIRPDGQPVSAFPPTERCIPAPAAGSCAPGAAVFQRNQGKKDNEFKTLDLRLAKDFKVGDLTIQPVIDVFNLTDEANFLIPETTSLAFNFDGTVRSGAG